MHTSVLTVSMFLGRVLDEWGSLTLPRIKARSCEGSVVSGENVS